MVLCTRHRTPIGISQLEILRERFGLAALAWVISLMAVAVGCAINGWEEEVGTPGIEVDCELLRRITDCDLAVPERYALVEEHIGPSSAAFGLYSRR